MGWAHRSSAWIPVVKISIAETLKSVTVVQTLNVKISNSTGSADLDLF